MPHPVADIFLQAAELNRRDQRRRGNTVHLGDDREVLVTGDVHGQRLLLDRILSYAALPANPKRILILQELIHGPLDPKSKRDRSIELLLRCARLKVAHPDQVLMVLSNHDLSQISGSEISKSGRSVCKQFADDVIAAFDQGGHEVLTASLEYLRSLPLAARCPNGVLIAHSIPSPHRMELAGTDILDRGNVKDDLRRGGAVYEWTWGRDQTREQIDALAAELDVEMFILGHRPIEGGYEVVGSRAVVIATDSPQGCIIVFSTDRPLTTDALQTAIKSVASI
ncbi:MAG: metallophosphoesterase [Planctomycetota bacterium]